MKIDLSNRRTEQELKQLIVDKLRKLQRYDVGTYCDRNWADECSIGDWIKSKDIDNIIKWLEE